MLDDRPYMRRDEGHVERPAWLVLIIINAACFAFQLIDHAYIRSNIFDYLALSSTGLKHGYVWQVLTFQFLHADLFHLLGNLIFGIWMFGRYIEDRLGTRNFLKIYFLSGIAGGLLQGVLGLFLNPFSGYTVGASAGTFGLVAAFCTLEPHSEIRLFFFLPIRAKHLLYLEIGIAAFFTLVPVASPVAHAAHLGGALFGWAFVHWVIMSSDRSVTLWRGFRKFRPRPELVAMPQRKRPAWKKPAHVAPAVAEELPPAEFISKEVDPILDKISAHGIQSLTDREKQILEAARKKMARK